MEGFVSLGFVGEMKDCISLMTDFYCQYLSE